MTGEIKDVEIVEQCLSGEVESFRFLVDKYQNAFIRTAFHFTHNWDDARDAAQEAFTKAYQSLRTFDKKRRLSTWLYQILINVCKDRLKLAFRRQQLLRLHSTEHSVPPNTLERIGEQELLHRSLGKLSFKRRRIIILVDMEGFSSVETAEILNCSESTVRVTLMKARQQLRENYLKLSEV